LALDQIGMLAGALSLNAGTDDSRAGKRRKITANQLGAIMRAVVADDAVDEVVELNLAVSVVHPLALSTAGAVLGETRATSSPVAL